MPPIFVADLVDVPILHGSERFDPECTYMRHIVKRLVRKSV